jgi:hypothetical protein
LVDSASFPAGAAACAEVSVCACVESCAMASSFASSEKLEKLNNNPRIIFEKYIFLKKVLIGIVILAFALMFFR